MFGNPSHYGKNALLAKCLVI